MKLSTLSLLVGLSILPMSSKRKHRLLVGVTASLLMGASWAQPRPTPECRAQQIETSRVEMCLARGSAFQHDTYMLRIDGALIFAIVDDYVEQVELQHTVPEGPSIEYALSKQGQKVIKIAGGCLPESKDGEEVARICNFHWGKEHVVRDQRFDFQ